MSLVVVLWNLVSCGSFDVVRWGKFSQDMVDWSTAAEVRLGAILQGARCVLR